MIEYTFEEFCALPMVYSFGLSLDTGSFRQYTHLPTGVSRETYTVRNQMTQKFGRTKTWFYIKGEKEVYHTADQVYVAYMEKVCGVTA